MTTFEPAAGSARTIYQDGIPRGGSMTDVQETVWLTAAQQGDTDAYNALFAVLEPDLRRFVRRMIDHADTVDDILQNIALKFYLNLSNIQPAENLRPYLFRIARNCCYDDLRRHQTWNDASIDDELVEMRVSFTASNHIPKPDDLTHWMLLGMEVRAAMDRLPDVQRQALLLFSEQSMSYAEIADIMDVSVGTVKSRLHHAKKTLRALMKPETVALLEDEFGITAAKKQLSLEGDPV